MVSKEMQSVFLKLEKELRYHKERADKIEAALSVLKDLPEDSGPQKNQKKMKKAKRTGWAPAIDAIFSVSQDNISIADLKKELIKKGFPADEKKYSNTIQNVLARRVGKTIDRIGPGIYRAKAADMPAG